MYVSYHTLRYNVLDFILSSQWDSRITDYVYYSRCKLTVFLVKPVSHSSGSWLADYLLNLESCELARLRGVFSLVLLGRGIL